MKNAINKNYRQLACAIVLQAIEDYRCGNKKLHNDAEKFLKSSLCDFYLGDIDQGCLLNILD